MTADDPKAPSKALRARRHTGKLAGEPDSTGGKQGGRFASGESGNPAGRPPGSRHAAFVALDAIGQAGAEAALRAVVNQATAGDMKAAEILLKRAWPERRGRPTKFDLPPMKAAADLPAVLQAVVSAVASGIITSDEGQGVAAILENHRKAIETADHEKRLDALERAVERGS